MSAMDDLARMLKRSRSPGSDYTGVVTKVKDGTREVKKGFDLFSNSLRTTQRLLKGIGKQRCF